MDLVTHLYSTTTCFPKEELYGLTSQIRRAAISIPSNIAEGAARHSRKEFIQFLHVASGSIAELETPRLLAARPGFGKTDDVLASCVEKARFTHRSSVITS